MIDGLTIEEIRLLLEGLDALSTERRRQEREDLEELDLLTEKLTSELRRRS
jgi:hypothetical protein